MSRWGGPPRECRTTGWAGGVELVLLSDDIGGIAANTGHRGPPPPPPAPPPPPSRQFVLDLHGSVNTASTNHERDNISPAAYIREPTDTKSSQPTLIPTTTAMKSLVIVTVLAVLVAVQLQV